MDAMKRCMALISVLSLLFLAAACFSAVVYGRNNAVSQRISQRILSNALQLYQSTKALGEDAASEIPAETHIPGLASAANGILADAEVYEMLHPREQLCLKEIASDVVKALQIMRYGAQSGEAEGLLKELCGYLNYDNVYDNLDQTKSGEILKEMNAAMAAQMQEGYYQLHLRFAALH